MFQGTGEDGCRTTLAEGNRVATALLQGLRSRDDALPDCTEAEQTSLWSPAPGAVVVLPERYTPTYAYPTLVWLAEPGDTEFSARDWLEEISARNFVGIGLRPELYAATSSGRVTRSPESSSRLRHGLSRFGSLLKCMENWVRLHPERRYVAGGHEAASVAIDWLLARPDWFAGAIAIDPPVVSTVASRAASPLVQRRRLLWINRTSTDSAADEPQRLALQCLGVQVAAVHAGERATPAALARRINRWVLEKVPTAILD